MHAAPAMEAPKRARRFLALLTGVLMVGSGLVATGATPAEAAAPGPKDTIAVLFSYTWNKVAEECENTLGPAGYGYVQTSPPQEHVLGGEWWTYYQPVSYKLESRMGTEAEFRSMIQRCSDAGVGVIVDAVINHMSGKSAGGTGWAGSSFQHYEYPGLYSSNDFHGCRRDITSYQSRYEVQECNLVNLSDLNTSSAYVQQKLADYLNGLVAMGVAGFRFDAVKHIAASDMQGIWNRVQNKDKLYVVQEVIRADEPIQPEEYTSNGDVHEFAFARKLKEAFGGSRIDWLITGAGIGGTWQGFLQQGDAAVFVDNHDTERNGETLSYKDGKSYDLAQTFTLAWPYGSPSVHSGYQFSNKDAGPAYDGQGRVIDPAPGQNGWTFKHAQNDIQNMVGFRTATYGTDVVNKWTSADGAAIAFGRGSKGFVAINNGGGQVQREFTTSLPDGTYYNVITAKRTGSTWSGDTITVSGGKFTATLAGKSAIALHVDAKVQQCVDQAAPAAPTAVTAAIEGAAVKVTWAAATDDCGVTGYTVTRTGGAGGAVTKSVTGLQHIDTEIAANTKYTYVVQATDGSGKTGAASAGASATTPEKPASQSTTVYYKAPAGWTKAYLHYRVGTGAWTTAPGKEMAPVAGQAGWFSLTVETAADAALTAAFTNGSGTWDNNASADYKIPAGPTWSVADRTVTAGAPEVPTPLAGTIDIFYKPSGWSAANAHYQIGSGAWTNAPGIAMSPVTNCTAGTGWYRLTIDTASATSVKVAFNNGHGVWDNNGGKDYTFTSPIGAVTGGKVSISDPVVGCAPTP